MRGACIDIGTNTTRLLVADCGPGGLREVHQERAFTHIRRGVRDGRIERTKIDEVADVVASQVRRAASLECAQIHGVATAAIRRAANGEELIEAIRGVCGLRIEVLSSSDEARLAFVGAARTLQDGCSGELGVVDVGGGSSELVVGMPPDDIRWFTSFALGSADVADACLRSDPPSVADLSGARELVARTLGGIDAPRPARAVAVGGSAASLCRLAGPRLDADAFARALELLRGERCAAVAARMGLDAERVRLLPAGLVILQAASELFGLALEVARGGLREGVLLEAADA